MPASIVLYYSHTIWLYQAKTYTQFSLYYRSEFWPISRTKNEKIDLAMSLFNDNHENKRQRTDKIEDNRIVVNVGGKLFPTFRSTLTMKSTYFKKRLSGRFSDDGDSEIIVDRDHEPFSIILSYLRSGKLLISPDKLLFSSVLIEADFYGIDELVDMVRDKCYCNLNHIEVDGFNDLCITRCLTEFPTYEHIIEHPKFPSMYFSQVGYRVISSHILPEHKYVRLPLRDGGYDYLVIWQAITFERLSDGTVFTEPALPYRDLNVNWTTLKGPLRWPVDPLYHNVYDEDIIQQHIPVSFWLGLQMEQYDNYWHTCTKTIVEPRGNSHKYTIRNAPEPETKTADVVEKYTLDSTNTFYMYAYELYVYTPQGTLINVKKVDHFRHVGIPTEEDFEM